MSILNAVKAARTNDRVKGGDSLFTLAKRGDAEHLEKMIDANGDAPMSEEELDEKTKHGYTALHLAVVNFQLECVQLLVDAGASLEAKTDFGETALDRCGSTAVRLIILKEKQKREKALADAAGDKVGKSMVSRFKRKH